MTEARRDTVMLSTDDLLKRVPVDPDVGAAFDAIPNELNEQGYDAWGFNPAIAKRSYSLARRAYRYFRPRVSGIEHLPAGRVLVIGNHSGQLPFDGLVVAVACLLEARPPRIVRPMAERWFPTLPLVNELFTRSGVAVGDPINCRNLLEAENAILVFPEGARGCGKVWSHRYRLVDFGRGFMRLALQTRAPIVPFAVVGAEEAVISLHDARGIARALGTPYFPISPFLPFLGPLAYFPLPTKFYVRFGAPMHFDGPFDDEDEVVQAKADTVKARVQQLIDDLLRERQSVF
jgi:1-acyl-sn-glycerol-3-phosphate acyltransferase